MIDNSESKKGAVALFPVTSTNAAWQLFNDETRQLIRNSNIKGPAPP